MKILMLDIDGVLNNDPYLMSEAIRPLADLEADFATKEAAWIQYMTQMLAPDNVNTFKRLLKELPDIKIGIHSNWIRRESMKNIKKAFKKAGIPVSQIYKQCPMKMSSNKCHHVAWYLRDRKNVEKCVIVDDCRYEICGFMHDADEFKTWYGENTEYYETDEKKGLTQQDVDAIVKLFNT